MKWAIRIGAGLAGLLGFLFIVLFIWSGGAKGVSKQNLSIQIDRPPAEVFAWLTEPPKLKQWINGFEDSIPLNGDSLRVGSRSREIINSGGDRFEMLMEVTELEQNKLLGFTMDTEIFYQNGRYSLTGKNGKTILSLNSETQLKPFFVRLIEPLFTKMAAQQMEQNFQTLKSLAEKQAI